MQDELDRMRRRLKAERENSEREQQEMIAAMQQAMEAARSKLTEERNAARKQADFLRRCRVEADAARRSFEQGLKRQQAFFDNAERDRLRREMEKAQHTQDQRRRAEQSYGGGHGEGGGGYGGYGDANFGAHGRFAGCPGYVPPPPPLISTAQQARAYGAFEAAFTAMEAAPADVATFGLASFPWPPAGCPVSGVRRTDTAEKRRQRLKLSLLRWHPDKFEAAHGGKIVPEERAPLMERVCEVVARVRHERSAILALPAPDEDAENADAAAASPTVRPAVYTPPPTADPYSYSQRARRGGGPRHIDPAASVAEASGGPKRMTRPSKRGQSAQGVPSGPRVDKMRYEGRYV